MTFSVEHFPDYTDVVLLDPSGNDNDVVVTFDETGEVWFRHQCPETDHVDLILMNYSMLTDLVAALDLEEGLYTSDSNPIQAEDIGSSTTD